MPATTQTDDTKALKPLLEHDRNAIYIIGGSKGGVGKSLVTMALLDHLTQKKGSTDDVLLIETDTSNPDVWKAYNQIVKSELCDLDEANGWVHFVNLCEKNPAKTIVVNTAARNNKGVASHGMTFSKSLPELRRRLITWWVINRQRDSLELLSDYLEVLPGGTTHVVRNGFFGSESQFELYNTSDLRKQVESAGGRSVVFPGLADRVADDLHSGRLAIITALSDGPKKLPLGNRAELERWREVSGKVFDGLLNA